MISKSEILVWAQPKGLLKKENYLQQTLKVAEEVGELAKAVIEQNKIQQKDAIGDVIISITILSEQLGFDVNECIRDAFKEIKDRKGQTINGTFIKETK